MADDKEISDLTAATAFSGTEVYHVDQSGNSRKGTPAQQRTYTLSNINQDIIPDGDGTRDLGSDPSATPTAGKAWAKVWADNYGDSDGLEVPSKYVTNGSAKILCNLNGSGTPATRESLGVSSVTDNGTGQFSINLSTSFANTDYTLVGVSSAAGNALTSTMIHSKVSGGSWVTHAPSAASFDVFIASTSYPQDSEYISIEAYGTLAT